MGELSQDGLLPPAGGWTLMEAADALCAEQARLYRAGGPALDAVVRAANGNWATILDPEPESWLADLLHAALCERADLVLTGRDLMRGVHAPRVCLTHDAMAAMLGPHSNQSITTYVYLDLRLGAGRAEIRYSVPGTPQNVPDDTELLDVRVEAAAGAAPAALTAPPVIKPAYSAEACRLWLLLRVRTWTAATPSTGRQCLAAASAYFADPVPRDAFLAMRRSLVPGDWLKPGPRGPHS
jgi:hypothetical protein